MKELHTEIEIAATAERVWRELTDFASYPQWNPFILAVKGEAREGEVLRVKIQVGKRALAMKPRVERVVPNRVLMWSGSLPVPGLFGGEHSFQIDPLGERRMRFHHWESFSGLLVPLLWRTLDGDTRGRFEEMNAALKARAERA